MINVFDQFSRTERLLGREAMEKLAQSRIAVFGIGGVGGYVVEALVRSGVGAIDLIDNDKVCRSNLNRQIIAVNGTVGRYKTDVMRERILDINPECRVEVHRCFYLPETKDEFSFEQYDYVVDAIDTVAGKIQLVLQAQDAGVPIISSMGAGNKLNPAEFEVADIYETSVCPLAKVMRRELKKRNVKKLKVVYSREEPIKPLGEPAEEKREDGSCPAEAEFKSGKRRAVPGSNAFVPSVVGLIIASEVVKDLVNGGSAIESQIVKTGEHAVKPVDPGNLLIIEANAFIAQYDENDNETLGMGLYKIIVKEDGKIQFICMDNCEPLVNFEYKLEDIINLLDYKSNHDPRDQTRYGIWTRDSVITLEFASKEERNYFDEKLFKLEKMMNTTQMLRK